MHLVSHPYQAKDLILYVNAQVYYDNTGNSLDLPAISIDGEPVVPLIEYFKAKVGTRTIAWMRKVREAVKLFLQYILAHPPSPEFGQATKIRSVSPYEYFQNFATSLQKGTFGPHGYDPSGLCWRSCSPEKSERTIRYLTNYFEWIAADKLGKTESVLNPLIALPQYDRMMYQAAYEHRRSRAFLGHTWKVASTTDRSNAVRFRRRPNVANEDPPAFPEEYLESLLFKGFFINGQYNWRDMLITILLNGAGYRVSEPMHLYLQDVAEDPVVPGCALVRIFHPEFGAAPSDWINMSGKEIRGSRRDYLMEKFSLKPRTELLTKADAGWKGGSHENAKKLYKQAYWFHPHLGTLFLRIWRKYIRQVAMIERAHPFAFINLLKNQGELYRISTFQESHAAAVRRAGLVSPSERDLKSLGLTPHGHRHAYAQRLKRAGIAPKIIMRCLHHSSIESQDVYTEPSTREITHALGSASQRLHPISFHAENALNLT